MYKVLLLITVLALTACAPSIAPSPATGSFEASAGQILEALSKAPAQLPAVSGYDGWYVASVGPSLIHYRNEPGLGLRIIPFGPRTVGIDCTWASSSPTLSAVSCFPAGAGQPVMDYLAKLFKKI